MLYAVSVLLNGHVFASWLPGKLDYGSAAQGKLQTVFMLLLDSGSPFSLKRYLMGLNISFMCTLVFNFFDFSSQHLISSEGCIKPISVVL